MTEQETVNIIRANLKDFTKADANGAHRLDYYKETISMVILKGLAYISVCASKKSDKAEFMIKENYLWSCNDKCTPDIIRNFKPKGCL